MEKKSKILIAFVFTLTLASAFLAFYRYGIKKNFVNFIKGSCDPATTSCFKEICEAEDERCLHFSSDEATRFYNIIYIKNSQIPYCDKNDEGCIDRYCSGSGSCKIYSCSDVSDEMKSELSINDECN